MAKAPNTYHHYVPRVYLNKFATIKGSNQVYVRYNGNQKFFLTNIDRICGEDHLYRMPEILTNLSDDEKLYVEKGFYGGFIESNYAKIYSVLVDETVREISEEIKEHLLMMPISLFFRHPVHLHAINQQTDHWLEHIQTKVDSNPNKSIMASLSGVEAWVNQSNFDDFKNRVKAVDKVLFLRDQIKQSFDLVKRKMKCGIGVYKLETGDFNFITSDKPVNFRKIGVESQGDDIVLDEDAAIYLPLDGKHLLIVMPESEALNPFVIHRFSSNWKEALVNNHVMEQQADKWIIGNETSVKQHVEEQKKYNEITPENLRIVEETKETAELLNELATYMENNGIRPGDTEVYRLVMKCKNSGLLDDDANFKQHMKQLEQYFGYRFE